MSVDPSAENEAWEWEWDKHYAHPHSNKAATYKVIKDWFGYSSYLQWYNIALEYMYL